MFDWVYIEKLPERDMNTLNLNLNEGLQPYNYFGYFFMAGATLFLLIALFKVRIVFPYFAIAILFGVGFFMNKKATNTYHNRISCFLKGDAIVAKVVKHTRTLNPFSSKQKYAIVLKYGNQQITVEHKSDKLWENFPIHADVIGLHYDKYFLFGPELGVDFKFFLENKSK